MSKVALVTGGNRGIGRATVLSLAKLGISSIFTYNSHPEEAEAVAKTVEAASSPSTPGVKAVFIHLDVSHVKAFPKFLANVKSVLSTEFQKSSLDILINNAGIGPFGKIAEQTEDSLDMIYTITYKSVFLLTQTFLPLLADGGRIVNVSTGLARFTAGDRAAYASMKAGIEVFTKYLAKEVGPRKIRVNCVRPGAIASDFGGGGVRDNEGLNKMMGSAIVLGRPGEAAEVGPVVAAVAGDEGFGWVNGTVIEVSGGQSI